MTLKNGGGVGRCPIIIKDIHFFSCSVTFLTHILKFGEKNPNPLLRFQYVLFFLLN